MQGDVAALVGVGAVAEPRVAPDGRGAFGDEIDDECVAREVAADGSDAPRVVSPGADFARDPAWSPDGTLLAWHEWDAPAMPWDGSRSMVASLDRHPRVAIGRGWHHGIEWGRGGVVAVRSGARTPPVVAVTDPATGARTEVAAEVLRCTDEHLGRRLGWR